MLSMHTATLGFIEVLLVGVAAKRRDETHASLKALNEARQKLAGQLMNSRVSGPISRDKTDGLLRSIPSRSRWRGSRPHRADAMAGR